MGGGLMQLVAYGAQDVYLTGNPQITFWKVTYRRHTNFAMESIEQTFNGQADFGRRVQCTISRNGDLAYRTYLQVTLPEIGQEGCCGGPTEACEKTYARWLDYPGEQLISMVEVEIGGQRIDRQYGDWMHIWNQLTLTAEQERGYNKMVGQTTQLTYLIDPSFADVDSACAAAEVPAAVCAPRNALPETTLYIPLQFWFCRNPGLALPLIALQYHEVKLNITFASFRHLVTKQDHTAGAAVAADVADASLSSAALYVDYIYLDTDERRRFAQVSHEYLIEQVQFTGEESHSTANNTFRLNFNHPVKELVWVTRHDDSTQPFNYTSAANGSGGNFTTNAKLTLNGHDRFSQRDGAYFNSVQPFQHHSNSPAQGVNCYSFALKPEDHQPSGTCNMSRIDNTSLKLTNVAADSKTSVYAVNYNVLRVMGGMGGLAYSN